MENQENLEPIGELKLVQPEYLFTINDAGEKLIEIDKTGNITYMKDEESLNEAGRVFWNSIQGNFLVIQTNLLDETPNDMELGKLVRQLYNKKTSKTKWMLLIYWRKNLSHFVFESIVMLQDLLKNKLKMTGLSPNR